MSLIDTVLGRRLATSEEGEQKVGPAAGIPMLGNIGGLERRHPPA